MKPERIDAKAQFFCILQVQNRIPRRGFWLKQERKALCFARQGLGSLVRSFMATDHGEVADKNKGVCRVSDELLTVPLIFFPFVYLFIWLSWVLVMAHGIFHCQQELSSWGV